MEEISKELRKDALLLSMICKDGNLQSVFSCLEIVWALYDKIMNWSPSIATSEKRDFFIISKGQATLALYPVLIRKGLFEREKICSEIGQFDSRYCIQTDLTKFEGGIENNAGSLGHGLPYAVGVAYGNKIKKIENYTYVLCGDGEFCEGTMWEACILASAKELDHLCVIIDDNNSIGAMVPMGDMQRKLETFGFDVVSVDGHDLKKLEVAFEKLRIENNGKPKAVIAKTSRGYGSKTMTENDIWFHKSPTEEEYVQLCEEVDSF